MCTICGTRFQAEKVKAIPIHHLWEKYSHGKQTQEQLGKAWGKSRKWVNGMLKQHDVLLHKNTVLPPQPTVLIVDTTYFHQFGLMVFRSVHLKKCLLWYPVDHETNELYQYGIQELINDGWTIQALVADGKPGLHELFPFIPFQLCQFHQFQIVTRYISKKPTLEAGKELRALMFLLTKTDEASFTWWLQEWHKKWASFLKERTTDQVTGKNVFTHKRLRSAYFSLQRNLPYLFTHERCFSHISIPNTTNALDGSFSPLKTKLAVHKGASKTTQLKLIAELIFT